MSKVQRQGEEMISQNGFLGVPIETFELAGRKQFISLLAAGLNPESVVLDLGCGCLRVAYWLVRFLDSGCYHGIDPVRKRVELGLHYLLTPEVIAAKQPRFDFNPHFNSSVFGARFDFFLAGSIWSHASKRQIVTTLDSFVRDSTPTAVFLTSYIPATGAEDDYQGDVWVGTSHESDVPGVIRHRFEWIAEQCAPRGLRVQELPGEAFDGQVWLKIHR